jgi:hypothetical protein
MFVTQRKPPTPVFPLCTLYPMAAAQALMLSAGFMGFVPNPTILYKFCSLYGGSLFIVGQRGSRVFKK